MKNKEIHDAISAIMESMRQQGTSPGRLKNLENAYHVFEQYLSDNHIATIDEQLCLEYVYIKTGQRYERFEYVTSNSRVDYRMWPLLLLLRYLKDGQFRGDTRKIKPPFVCPPSFASAYEAFCEELVYRGYSQATIDANRQKVQKLVAHLVEQGVTASADITIQHVEDYLKT